MVQQGNVVAVGHLKAAGGVGRNTAVFHRLVHDGTGHGLGQASFQALVRVTGIHQHQLPVLVGLACHAAQHFVKKLRRCVIQRHDDADFRSLQVRRTLGFQLPFQRNIRPVTPIVMVQRQPDAELHVAPKLLGPLLVQGGGSALCQIAQVGRVQQALGHAAHAVLYGQVGGAFVVRFLAHRYSSVILAGMASFFSNLRYSAVISAVGPRRRRWP